MCISPAIRYAPFAIPEPPARGAIAQLGERLLCKQEVVGSIPSGSTSRVREVRPHRNTFWRPLLAYRPGGPPRCLTS